MDHRLSCLSVLASNKMKEVCRIQNSASAKKKYARFLARRPGREFFFSQSPYGNVGNVANRNVAGVTLPGAKLGATSRR